MAVSLTGSECAWFLLVCTVWAKQVDITHIRFGLNLDKLVWQVSKLSIHIDEK